MPRILANSQNFKLNTDFPPDKVIYMSSGTFTTGTPTQIPHNLPYTPLIIASWSKTSSFNESYETSNSVTSTSPYDIAVLAGANSTNILINSFSNPSPQTLFYRVYALQRSDVSASVPSTSSKADIFIYNTDFDSAKTFITGVGPFSTVQSSFTINHNLGYKPQILAWEEDNGIITPLNYVDSTNLQPTASATISQAIFTTNSTSSNARRIHYRIYANA